jgi:hypothetical protein
VLEETEHSCSLAMSIVELVALALHRNLVCLGQVDKVEVERERSVD